ncbi:uncharacterized protein LOC126792129 [Argentina anserina]|uniref:uncharacterized protein LOC126784044 n=3 Tax=Argentina anserina TaxID=57926 RepID=UPI0021764F68|nr:uncharacterized protein LOC126784044 [Potentilla anserina]XP_050374572.1 uncharacterized protein LOC126792129 [Potentilla anserina]
MSRIIILTDSDSASAEGSWSASSSAWSWTSELETNYLDLVRRSGGNDLHREDRSTVFARVLANWDTSESSSTMESQREETGESEGVSERIISASGTSTSGPTLSPAPVRRWLDGGVQRSEVEEAYGADSAAVSGYVEEFKLPGTILARAIRRDEFGSMLPNGHALVSPSVLRLGVELPLDPRLQCLVAEFGLAFGQVSYNMWRVLLGLCSLFYLSGCSAPTAAEVLHFFKVDYNQRNGNGGTARFVRRDERSEYQVLENWPTSEANWRKNSFVVEDGWEYGRINGVEYIPRKRIPSRFRAINSGRRLVLSEREVERVNRVTYLWRCQGEDLVHDLKVLTNPYLLFEQGLLRRHPTTLSVNRNFEKSERVCYARFLQQEDPDVTPDTEGLAITMLRRVMSKKAAASTKKVNVAAQRVEDSSAVVDLSIPLHANLPNEQGLPRRSDAEGVGRIDADPHLADPAVSLETGRKKKPQKASASSKRAKSSAAPEDVEDAAVEAPPPKRQRTTQLAPLTFTESRVFEDLSALDRSPLSQLGAPELEKLVLLSQRAGLGGLRRPEGSGLDLRSPLGLAATRAAKMVFNLLDAERDALEAQRHLAEVVERDSTRETRVLLLENDLANARAKLENAANLQEDLRQEVARREVAESLAREAAAERDAAQSALADAEELVRRMSEEAEAEKARVAEEAASSAVTAFKSSMEMTKYLEGYYVTAVGDMIAQFQELEMLDPADYEVRLSEKGLEPPPMPHEVTPPFSQPTSTAEAEGEHQDAQPPQGESGEAAGLEAASTDDAV